MNFKVLLWTSIFLFAPFARAADLPPINEALPQDSLCFVEMEPAAAAAHPSAGGLANASLEALHSLGLLHDDAGSIADILSLAGTASECRSCIALLDADLRSTRDGAIDCRSVQLVWIIETRQPAELLERITRLIAPFSSRTTVHQSVKKAAEGKKEFVEFRDSRWPVWLTLAWAQESPAASPESPATVPGASRFIFALGPGAMEHYLADRPEGEVPWKPLVAAADSARDKQSRGDLLARGFVSPKAFRDRFPDAMQHGALAQLFASLDLASADSCIFTARIHDRAVSLDTGTFPAAKFLITPWTVDLPASSPLLKAVPPDAGAFAVLNIKWPDVYHRVLAFSDAVAANPAGTAEKNLTDTADHQGIDIKKDILDRMETLVLLHDSPQHPLHLPLMFTAIAAAEPGSGDKVQAALTKLTASAAVVLDRNSGAAVNAATPPPTSTANFTHLRLRTDETGLSYLQFGLVGPAWSWTQNRFVLSWSPGAVRANLAAAAQVPSTSFQSPTPRIP